MYILGSGMAGLLCAILNPGSTIIEKEDSTRLNHHAVLRLRTDEISKLTGIPMKKVIVHKAVWSEDSEKPVSIKLAHQYSIKTTGRVTDRSIYNLQEEERYIPPTDFFSQLYKLAKSSCQFRYGEKITGINAESIFIEGGQNYGREGIPVVSTLPMPVLSRMMGGQLTAILPKVFFADPIFVTQYEVENTDSYCTIYYPDPGTPVYRATLSGSTLIIEATSPIKYNDASIVLDSFGLLYKKDWLGITIDNYQQHLGKISPIDQRIRQDIILQGTLQHGVYSLGRFATWRPKVMLDDLVTDIFQIRKMIQEGRYSVIKYNQQEKNS